MWRRSLAAGLARARDLGRRLRRARAARPLRVAPYPLSLYRDLLASARGSRVRLAPYWSGPDGPTAGLFVRHDVDTAGCAARLPLLLAADLEQGVRPGVYYRADDAEYRLADQREPAEAALALPSAVGLHTVCYLADHPLDELRREADRFEAALGFRPRTFTVHGLGEVRRAARLRFYDDVAARLAELGFEFADLPRRRPYDHVIEDCHLDPAGRRFVRRDFARVPGFFRAGRAYLLLTHPTYWQPDPA